MRLRDIPATKRSISMEDQLSLYSSLEVISTESIIGLVNSFAGNVTNNIASFLRLGGDPAFKDAMKNRKVAVNNLKEMNTYQLSTYTITIPESLTGSFNSLLNDIIAATTDYVDELEKASGYVLVDLAMNINNSQTGVPVSPTATTYIRELKKKREAFTSKLGSHFKISKSVFLSPVVSHFRTPNEVIQCFDLLSVVDRNMSRINVDKLIKLSEDMSTQANLYSSIVETKKDFKNNKAVKETTENLYEMAKALEFVGYVQTLALQSYATVQDIGLKFSIVKH